MTRRHKEGRNLLLVHAHPDDESIFTGATIAKYAAEGTRVTLVTCTMGERGPAVLTPGRGSKESWLGEHRAGELAAACAALGVTDHRFLGGPGRWRDSGGMGTPGNSNPRCFWRADVDEAARELAAVIREVRPHALVTYDRNGCYGHPDHIQAHRVAWRAFQLACDPRLTKFYAAILPSSALAEAIKLGEEPPSGFRQAHSVGELSLGVPDEQVTTEIDAAPYLDAKLAAMRAHATQIAVQGQLYALPGWVWLRALGREYYSLLAGPGGVGSRSPGPRLEDDLFQGL